MDKFRTCDTQQQPGSTDSRKRVRTPAHKYHKDTSLFSVIGVGELVRQGEIYIATTFDAMEVHFVEPVRVVALART